MKPGPLYRGVLLRLFPRRFRERYSAEMEETFAAHLARAAGPVARGGVWLGAVRDAVRGGLRERWREGRDPDHSRGGGGMHAFWTDLRFAARGLARRPGLTLSAVVTLALGIGASTAIFSVVNGLLFRPFPYSDADRLVRIWAEHPERGWSETDVNPADAWDWRNRSGAFEDLAVFNDLGIALTGGDRPEVVAGVVATPNFFDVLGVPPAEGRGFTEADGREAAPPVAILGHGFWERRFASDPGILGRELILDGEIHTVVGVMGPGFRFFGGHTDLFTALRRNPSTHPRGSHGMEALARLRPGVTPIGAHEAVNEVARALQTEHPETNAGWFASVTTLRDQALGNTARQASLVLSGAVGFLLLMACVNVANLLLSRAGTRRGEMAVRTALGAGRRRLVRLLLTETLVLATIGALLGMGLAEGGRRLIVAGLPDTMPPVFSFELDLRVLAFALAVTLVSAVLSGLLPALRTAVPAGELRSGRRVGGSSRLAGVLVGVQTALAIVLLVAGGILARSVVAMRTQDFGWDADRVLYVFVTLSESRYPGAVEIREVEPRLRAAVAGVRGVEAVGAIQSAPLQSSNWSTAVTVTDPAGEVAERPARVGYLTPGYFEAMGIPVRAGRDLSPADGADAPPVALVNETFQRRYLGETDVVGTTVRDAGGAEVTLVGVVADHVERGVDRPPEAAIYRPMAQNPTRPITFAVRSAGAPVAVAGAVQEALWSVDSDLPVREVTPLVDLVSSRVGGYGLIAQLMGGFAAISLILGAVGIYGVTAHSVAQRWREIGIRLAMGADRPSVVRMVVVHGVRRAGIGVLAGLALAIPLSGALAGLAVGVDTRDPLLFAAVTATLGSVALVASWIPARRASRLDPARTLTAD